MTDETLIGKEKSQEEREASLPAVVKHRTEEQREADAAKQAELAQKVASPFVQGSPAEMAHARAVRLEADWRASIESIRAAIEIDQGGRISARRPAELVSAYNNAASQLAEALAAQGKFEEAASWELVNGHLRNEYLAFQEAIDRPDEDDCGDECARAFALNPKVLTQVDVIREVWSPKHNAVVAVLRCNMCGDLNARPLGAHDRDIQKRRQARQQALELTRGQDPVRAAETLKLAGLDPEKLFA